MSQSVTMAYVTIMEKIREERNQGDPDKETQGKAVEDTAVIYNDDLTAAIQLFELLDTIKEIEHAEQGKGRKRLRHGVECHQDVAASPVVSSSMILERISHR